MDARAGFQHLWSLVRAQGDTEAGRFLGTLSPSCLVLLDAEQVSPLLESTDPVARTAAIAALAAVSLLCRP